MTGARTNGECVRDVAEINRFISSRLIDNVILYGSPILPASDAIVYHKQDTEYVVIIGTV